MSRGRLIVVALILTALVASCSGGRADGNAERRYVSIGDSYVSGPGIDVQDPQSSSCARSDHNYPHLVAEKLKRTSLLDVSCGGATTNSVKDGRAATDGGVIRPQLDALTRDTDLVTVGIGGNDAGLISGLFVYCLVETSATDAECTKLTEVYLPTIYDGTRDRVSAILREIKRLSPRARVLLVGYLRIVPDSGDCPLLRMTETMRANAMKVELSLTSALRQAAKAADVEFVDVRGISQGHDVCAGKNACVNGTANVPGDGFLLHPNKAGMRAVTARVLQVIGDS